MEWKEYLINLDFTNKTTSFELRLPVSDGLLCDLQIQLGLKELPPELEELYRQSNGVDELSNKRIISEFIWTVDKVIQSNKEYRKNPDFKELYMSFDQLLFFSDAGNGDLFGFITLNGKFDRSDVFVWNHETDSRSWIAPNLATFVKWWASGTIKV